MALTREEILATRKSGNRVKSFDVPNWGPCYLGRMSGADRDEWDIWYLAQGCTEDDEKAGRGAVGTVRQGTKTVRAKWASMVLRDESGNRLFSDADLSALADLDGESLSFIWDEGRKFNGIGREAAEAIRKNLQAVPSEDGGSDLLANSE